MRFRRKPVMTIQPERLKRALDICPSCGHTSKRGEGRLEDPVSHRAVCIRCGAEIGKEKP